MIALWMLFVHNILLFAENFKKNLILYSKLYYEIIVLA